MKPSAYPEAAVPINPASLLTLSVPSGASFRTRKTTVANLMATAGPSGAIILEDDDFDASGNPNPLGTASGVIVFPNAGTGTLRVSYPIPGAIGNGKVITVVQGTPSSGNASAVESASGVIITRTSGATLQNVVDAINTNTTYVASVSAGLTTSIGGIGSVTLAGGTFFVGIIGVHGNSYYVSLLNGSWLAFNDGPIELTSSPVDGIRAYTVLDFTAGDPAEGDFIEVGGATYTFTETASVAYEVQIVTGDTTATMQNFVAEVNGDGVASANLEVGAVADLANYISYGAVVSFLTEGEAGNGTPVVISSDTITTIYGYGGINLSGTLSPDATVAGNLIIVADLSTEEIAGTLAWSTNGSSAHGDEAWSLVAATHIIAQAATTLDLLLPTSAVTRNTSSSGASRVYLRTALGGDDQYYAYDDGGTGKWVLLGDVSLTNAGSTVVASGRGFYYRPLVGQQRAMPPAGLGQTWATNPTRSYLWQLEYWSPDAPTRRWRGTGNHPTTANWTGSAVSPATGVPTFADCLIGGVTPTAGQLGQRAYYRSEGVGVVTPGEDRVFECVSVAPTTRWCQLMDAHAYYNGKYGQSAITLTSKYPVLYHGTANEGVGTMIMQTATEIPDSSSLTININYASGHFSTWKGVLASAPPVFPGGLYKNSVDGKFYACDGTTWVALT